MRCHVPSSPFGSRLRRRAADLDAAINADPKAVLVMHTDPTTRYERFDQVLAVVKRAGVTRLGFHGNEALAGSF